MFNQKTQSRIKLWERRYREQGVEGLKLGYTERISYLSSRERQQVIQWLKQKQEWNLEELISELLGFSGFSGLACGWCQD